MGTEPDEARIFLDGEEVLAICVNIWPDDGVIEISEGGAVVRKRGRVEIRRVKREVVVSNDNSK